MLGFKRFDMAAITISGVELAEKIKKAQFQIGKLPISFATAPAVWARQLRKALISHQSFLMTRKLFGRLEQSELGRAFQQAQPIHCSDLVGQTGEWTSS